MTDSDINAGNVISLWRYPVKSMIGEELESSSVTARGLLFDRTFALVDSADGKVVSAKNPRKWAKMFDFSANCMPSLGGSDTISPVRIILPDGSNVYSDQPDINQVLSNVLGRDVQLRTCEISHHETVETTSPNPWTPGLEEYWPDIEGLTYRDTVTDESMPEGTFFDLAVIHLLTTSTLARLHELYPEGRFEVPRFRPNIVIETASDKNDFTENQWIGKTINIGEEVQLFVFKSCQRCVMTTLPQGNLPADHGILKTAAVHNNVSVGVYCTVQRSGLIRRGDTIQIT